MLILVLVAFSAACVVLLLFEVVAGSRQAALARRLAEFQEVDNSPFGTRRRRQRQAQAEKLTGVIEALGHRFESGQRDVGALRLWLAQAGFTNANALPLYLGSRILLPATLAFCATLLLPTFGLRIISALFTTVWLVALGYIAPAFYVGARRRARQHDMQKAMPDALDMLVVCVEAGLGLNQALVRVADEIARVSSLLSEQFTLVNLEIRAGTPRDDALRNLSDRTGLDDIRSLAAMLIQTDRFGTSIAQALRVQSDTLRTKRRQRAEEAAAKTTIKLVFPLVLFIFPAMFVVILGPALIQILEALSGFRL